MSHEVSSALYLSCLSLAGEESVFCDGESEVPVTKGKKAAGVITDGIRSMQRFAME